MKRPVDISQSCAAPTVQGSAPPEPPRHAGTPVLPGEDPAEFQALLQDLYAVHRPRTRNEARCVDALADYEWCLLRTRGMRRHYHGKLLALHAGMPDAAGGVHCERDPHRWYHSAMDCSLEANRLGRLQEQELRKLEQLKKQRLRNLAADTAEVAERAETIAPRDTLLTRPAPGAPAMPLRPTDSPVSADPGNGKVDETGQPTNGRSAPSLPPVAIGRDGPGRPRRFPPNASHFTEIEAVPSG